MKNKFILFEKELVLCAVCMLIFSFAVPGKRTYVGRNLGERMDMPQEISEIQISGDKSVELASIENVQAVPENKANPVRELRSFTPLEASLSRTIAGSEAFSNGVNEAQVSLPKSERMIPVSSNTVSSDISSGDKTESATTVESSRFVEVEHPPQEEIVTNEDILKYYEKNEGYFKK